MGKLVGGVVGGVLSNKSAKKQARQLEAAGQQAAVQFQPFQQSGVAANALLSGALGIGGDPLAAQRAFQQFQNSTGFQSQLAAGQQAITGSNAARGLLDSGATAQALTSFGQDLAQRGFGNFLGMLGGVAGQGLNAAQGVAGAIGGAGQQAAASRAAGGQALGSGIAGAIGGFPLPGFLGFLGG